MIRVQEGPFDPGLEFNAFIKDRTEVGAVASFVGLVRDMAGEPSIDAMTLEHYPGMTEHQLEKIEKEAVERFALQDSLIVHRYGRMTLGEPIVMVLTASPHRADALDACGFLIDWLKTKAPFWKLEESAGKGHWVEAKESDNTATERWLKP